MKYERLSEGDQSFTSMNNISQEAPYTDLSTQPALESPKMEALNTALSTQHVLESINMDYEKQMLENKFVQNKELDAYYDNLMSVAEVIEKGELDAMKPEVSSFKLLVTYVFDFDLELTESETMHDSCNISASGLLGLSDMKVEENVEAIDDDQDTCDDDFANVDDEKEFPDYDIVEVVENDKSSEADSDKIKQDRCYMKGSKNNLLEDITDESLNERPAEKDQLECDLEKILERLDIEEDHYANTFELQVENDDYNSELGNSLTSIPSFDGQYHNSDLDSENDDDDGKRASSCSKNDKNYIRHKSKKSSGAIP